MDRNSDLSKELEAGFGPSGLGIIAVSEVPGYASLRRGLLYPTSRYSFGWSHGKEKLESGSPDFFKGSFYAHPLMDIPIQEGEMLIPVCRKNSLEDILRNSQYHKGRLLHYFPCVTINESENQGPVSSWCGWHTDHGSLTGLTSAMYMRDGIEISCPDENAALYVRMVNEEIKKASNVVGVSRNTFALFMQPSWDQPLHITRGLNRGDESEVLALFGGGWWSAHPCQRYRLEGAVKGEEKSLVFRGSWGEGELNYSRRASTESPCRLKAEWCLSLERPHETSVGVRRGRDYSLSRWSNGHVGNGGGHNAQKRCSTASAIANDEPSLHVSDGVTWFNELESEAKELANRSRTIGRKRAWDILIQDLKFCDLKARQDVLAIKMAHEKVISSSFLAVRKRLDPLS
ncbi:hypothetical protein KP509_01G102600 [Ceratopteris richardii]|uniref:Uncharacterized protein n=1 Tax=Ceratopteris richardii TaxID=49495 RepID=A0A8T2VSF5_CERRI|nr:hypothetical protein KP509_01G102600 [Ceratopteris richardii]